MPAFGSILAVLLLGEAFRLYHLAGIGLILAGVTLRAAGDLSRYNRGYRDDPYREAHEAFTAAETTNAAHLYRNVS